MDGHEDGVALGKENDEAKDSVIANHADDLSQWEKAGAVEACIFLRTGIDVRRDFDKTKYVAIPDGRVPVFRTLVLEHGQRMLTEFLSAILRIP